MDKIIRTEAEFCNRHGIPKTRLFDATGLKRAIYSEIMKADEKWAAFNVTPCERAGHQLRNRHGTCLMCNVQSVAHMLRAKSAGYVYVAQGATNKLMKIGFSRDPSYRLSIARYEGWGGHYDWRLAAFAWSRKAGHIEGEIHKYFYGTRKKLHWIRNGRVAVAREAYDCNLPEAVSQLTYLCDEVPVILP